MQTKTLSLRSKFYYTILPIVGVVMLTIVIIFNMKNYFTAFDQFEEKKYRVAREQAELVVNPVWYKDKENIEKILKALVSDHDIVGAYIELEEEGLFVSSGVPYHVAKEYEIMTNPVIYRNDWGKDFLGYIKIAFSTAHINQAIKERLLFEVAMVFLVLLILVLAVLLFNRKNIEAPLKRLLNAIDKEQGSEDALVEYHRHDEIGEVIHAFNEMRQKDWRQSEALQKANANLEQKVEERTHHLKVAFESLQKVSQAKDDFMTMMSHEIRTPMNNIIRLSDLLKESEMSFEAGKYAHMIHASTHMLLNTINDILDLSKLEASQCKLQMTEFNLEQSLQNVIQGAMEDAKQKNIGLRLELQSTKDDTYIGDISRIKQVLSHLLNNAIAYTDEGQVIVKASVEATEDSENWLWIKVIDTGPGIEEEHIDKIFDKFTRIEQEASQKKGGAGLGLAICKRVISLLQGYIGVDSTCQKGSTFWFKVPLESTCHTRISKNRSSVIVTNTNLKILIAEHNMVNQMALRGMLQKYGYKPVIVDSGDDVIKALTNETFDILLLDTELPDINGIDMASAIRSLPSGIKHIPIVAITSNEQKGDKQRFLAHGMDDFIAKPIEKNHLIQTIQKVTQHTSFH